MKIRNGFVSNSSSSSFTCVFSGEVFSGWDSLPEDFGCVESKNGFMQEHLLIEYLRKVGLLEKYEELMQYLTQIDLSEVKEEEDNVDLQGELACSGGACEIR